MASPSAGGWTFNNEPTKQEIFEVQIARFYEYIDFITNRNNVEMSSEQRRQYLQEHYAFDKFRDAMYDIFGDEIKADDIKTLYRRVSAHPECDVDWCEVFGYGDHQEVENQWRAAEAKEKHGDNVVDDDKVIVTKLRRQVADAAGSGSKRRDIIRQILYVPIVDCYVTVSQHGLVQVLSAGKYNIISSLTVQQGDLMTTSCCFLPNLRRLAIATDRELCIWDYRSPSRESFVITPFPSSILCLAVVTPDPLSGSQFSDSLLFGDIDGNVGMVTIHQKDLNTKTPHKKQNRGGDERSGGSSNSNTSNMEKDGSVHMIDIATLTTPIICKKVHSDWTMSVEHCVDLDMFASCSPSSHDSFIAEDLSSLESPTPYSKYVTVDKGCNAFCYSDRSNIFVTGGSDKVLRIWHPGIYSKPAGKLHGHIFSIIDVAVNDADQQIISVSSARLIRVWDIHTLSPLQVFGDNVDRPGERRIHCMIYDGKNEVLLTGSSVVDEWPLARKYHATILIPQTHPYSIMMMAVNEQLGQVLTSDTSPQIRIWDIESGTLLAQIDDPHNNNLEVVAAAFDPTGYRMVTGGMNGSIRIWDFGSIQVLKRYDAPSPDDIAVLSLTFYKKAPIPGINYVIGLGWGGKIKVFRDATSEMDVIELCDFSQPDIQEPDMIFMPIILNQEEARNYHQEMKLEEERMIVRGHPRVGQQQQPEGYRQKIRKSVNSRNTTSMSTTRDPSNMEDILRKGHNRGLFLSENGRTLVTGSDFGHLVQWDLQSMEMEVKWKFSSKQNTNESIENQTPVTTSSMSSFTDVEELRRVNALIVVRPTVVAAARKEKSSSLVDSETSEEESKSESEPEPTPDPETPRENTGLVDPPETIKIDDESDDEDPPLNTGAGTGDALYSNMSVIVTAHQDSWIRFWTFSRKPHPNRILHKVQMEINATPSPVTCLCSDADSTMILAADFKGFVSIWAMQLSLPPKLRTKIVKNAGRLSRSTNHPGFSKFGFLLEMIVPNYALDFKVSWKAHNSKIEDIYFYEPHNTLFTASADGSVRIWKGFSSKYLGFFGQPQPFAHTGRYIGPVSQPILPDIDEKPTYPPMSEALLQRKRESRRIRDLPLILDRSRWDKKSTEDDQDKEIAWHPKLVKDRYFDLLVKPKVHSNAAGISNTKAESLKKKTGIYRALNTFVFENADEYIPKDVDFANLDDRK